MKNNWVVCAVFILSFFAATAVFAQMTTPKIGAMESGSQCISYIESGEVLYNTSWTCTRSQSDPNLYTIETKGDNNTQGEGRIQWTEKVVFSNGTEGLRVQSWVKKSTGAEKQTWDMSFDWGSTKIDYSWADAIASKNKKKAIDFSGTVFAGDSMLFVLRGFPFDKGAGAKITGQLLDPSGMIISGDVIFIGEENIKTPLGTVAAYKLELKPSSFFLGMIAPTTYMWFTKADPHIWLRTDGKDNGMTNPKTKNVLKSYKSSDFSVQ